MSLLLFYLMLGLSIMTGKVKAKPVVRHETNPFLEGMIVPVKNQRVKISRLGKDDNVLINQGTHESYGTHVTTFRRVDADQFVKLFTANIALTFDLKAAGIKAFNVLLWILQNKSINKDLVPLDKFALEEFLEAHDDRSPPIQLSQPTFWRGLAELETAQIVAKHVRAGWYFVNPNFAFNGDRIAFTTLIERAARRPDNKTIDMFDPEAESEEPTS